MSLTQTSLSSAINASQLRLPVTSTATGFPGVGSQAQRQVVMIDAEKMLLIGVPIANVIDVAQRGYDNSVAVPHDTLAPVFTSPNNSDFIGPTANQLTWPNENQPDMVTIGQDLTLTALPAEDTIYTIVKASAAAIVLPSAAVGQASVRLTFICATGFTHTITYTPGFLGDGTASDVATSSGKIGASLVIETLPNGTLGLAGAPNNFTLG